jgi:hypothetical protein
MIISAKAAPLESSNAASAEANSKAAFLITCHPS